MYRSHYTDSEVAASDCSKRKRGIGRLLVNTVRDSIMTTIIHYVRRVTSTGSSEELAESHVNKTTRLATEDSESPGEDSEGAFQAPSRHPPSIPPET
jgi:hypothetical protein